MKFISLLVFFVSITTSNLLAADDGLLQVDFTKDTCRQIKSKCKSGGSTSTPFKVDDKASATLYTSSGTEKKVEQPLGLEGLTCEDAYSNFKSECNFENDDFKKLCQDQYNEFTDAVKDSAEKRAEKQLDRATKQQEIEEKIADEEEKYQEKKIDLQDALTTAQENLESKLLEIENEKTTLDAESQQELDALLEEYREGSSEVQKLLTTERQRVIDGYQQTVKNLSRECRNNAQKLVGELVAQRNTGIQNRARGVVPPKSLGTNFASQTDSKRIQQLISSDFKECQNAKFDIEAEANRTLGELNNNAQSTQQKLVQVERKVQQTTQKVEQLSSQLAKKAELAQKQYFATVQRIQQEMQNADQNYARRSSMYQQQLAQLNSELIAGNGTLIPGLRNNSLAGFDYTEALKSDLYGVCCKPTPEGAKGKSTPYVNNSTLSSLCKRKPRGNGFNGNGRR